jgi:hypothetical protein
VGTYYFHGRRDSCIATCDVKLTIAAEARHIPVVRCLDLGDRHKEGDGSCDRDTSHVDEGRMGWIRKKNVVCCLQPSKQKQGTSERKKWMKSERKKESERKRRKGRHPDRPRKRSEESSVLVVLPSYSSLMTFTSSDRIVVMLIAC